MSEKKTKGWNLAEMQETLVKDTEQKIEQGFKEIAGKGKGTDNSPLGARDTQGTVPTVTPVSPDGERAASHQGQSPSVPQAAAQAQQQAVNVYQEPTQNINIPIPISQHTRLAVIKAHTRQTIKDLVVQAIDLWLDVQEGKKKVSATI